MAEANEVVRELILPERLDRLAEQYRDEASDKEREADGLRERELTLRAEVAGLRSAVTGLTEAREEWELVQKQGHELVGQLPSNAHGDPEQQSPKARY